MSSTTTNGTSGETRPRHPSISLEVPAQHAAEYEKLGVLPKPVEFTSPDPHLSFLQKPHTLTLLFAALALLCYLGFSRDTSNSVSNTKAGLIASVLIFLFFSMLQMRDGLFYRPHPAFWRVVMGAAVVYLVFMVWLLFQSPYDARHIWTYIDPKLGVPLPERDYAADCRIYTPESEHPFQNVKNTVLDEFMVAHVVGWFAKSFLFRDVYICWAWSILFELCELSLAHILPNFRECWWDQIILDVLVCNAIGIYLGHLVMYHFEMRTFNWAGISENNSAPAIARAFWPYNWTRFKWKIFSTPQRFFAVCFLIVLAAVIELNCFFLKYVLWHPPPHPLVFWRLVIMWFFCLPALREYYQWVADPDCKKLGTMAWLSIAILGVEILVWVKFSEEMMAHAAPTPPLVIWAWTIAITCLLLFAFVYFVLWKPYSRKRKLAKLQATQSVAGNKKVDRNTQKNNDKSKTE